MTNFWIKKKSTVITDFAVLEACVESGTESPCWQRKPFPLLHTCILHLSLVRGKDAEDETARSLE